MPLMQILKYNAKITPKTHTWCSLPGSGIVFNLLAGLYTIAKIHQHTTRNAKTTPKRHTWCSLPGIVFNLLPGPYTIATIHWHTTRSRNRCMVFPTPPPLLHASLSQWVILLTYQTLILSCHCHTATGSTDTSPTRTNELSSPVQSSQ